MGRATRPWLARPPNHSATNSNARRLLIGHAGPVDATRDRQAGLGRAAPARDGEGTALMRQEANEPKGVNESVSVWHSLRIKARSLNRDTNAKCVSMMGMMGGLMGGLLLWLLGRA